MEKFSVSLLISKRANIAKYLKYNQRKIKMLTIFASIFKLINLSALLLLMLTEFRSARACETHINYYHYPLAKLEHNQQNWFDQYNNNNNNNNNNNLSTLLLQAAEQEEEEEEIEKNETRSNRRMKRRISLERHIELLAVVDQSFVDYHGAMMARYLRILLSMVSHILRHETIGNAITLKLVSITEIAASQLDYDTAHKLLRSFCVWQNARNVRSDDSIRHHDTALLLTRRDLCGGGPSDNQLASDCSMVGLANVGQICRPEYSCFIVRDTGLGTAFTIAHELGHVLGVPHDDQPQCTRFYRQRGRRRRRRRRTGPKKKVPKNDRKKVPVKMPAVNQTMNKMRSNIMASVQTGINRIWAWSDCSRHLITKHLRENGKCLLEDQTHPSTIDALDRFGGRFYDPDQQCKLRFGDDGATGACRSIDVCARLWCADRVGRCLSDNSPWADGTECGPDRWCYQGKCVRSAQTLRPVDGHWGEWSRWSACSGTRKCEQSSTRRCDRPKPQYGGRYCVGERTRVRACNQNCKRTDKGDANKSAKSSAKKNVKNSQNKLNSPQKNHKKANRNNKDSGTKKIANLKAAPQGGKRGKRNRKYEEQIRKLLNFLEREEAKQNRKMFKLNHFD